MGLIVTPMQRIPRYKMLVAELLKNTPEEHDDFKDLTEALVVVDTVAKAINEQIKERENRDRIRKIESQFISEESLIAPSRRFIRQGKLHKKSRRKDIEYEFFLFNDLLIYASTMPGLDKYKLHRRLEIDQVFHVTIDEKNPNNMQVVNSNKSFICYSESEATTKSWFDDITKCSDDIREKFSRRAQGSVQGEQTAIMHARAVWEQDKDAKNCKICYAKFTSFKRRHHCRKCGGVVCADCSKARLQLRPNKGKERVCSKCAAKHGSDGRASVLPTSPTANSLSELNGSTTTIVEEEDGEDSGYESGVVGDEEGPFPPGWVMYETDEEVPRKYYYNADTEQTEWERPRADRKSVV